MAGEYKVNVSTNHSKGGFSHITSCSNIAIDIAGVDAAANTQTATSAFAAVDTGAVSAGTAYRLSIKNLGTAKVLYRQGTGTTLGGISPGEVVYLGEIQSTTVQISATPDTLVEVLAVKA